MAFKILGRLALLAAVFLAVAMVYSTAKGYIVWFFRVDGAVTVNGQESSGYMHANTQRTALLITRTDGPIPETYLVPVGTGKAVFDCGQWHPWRFFPIAVGDLNPPCLGFKAQGETGADLPVDATLVRTRRSVEFSTMSGRKVKAQW